MKLSVSAFRAQASAQRKILSSYQNQLNYGACTSFPALGGFKIEEKPQMMVDSTGIGPAGAGKAGDRGQNSDNSGGQEEPEGTKLTEKEDGKEMQDSGTSQAKESAASDKSPGRTRTKSNQRWMKLRTTVQLSGAITSTSQKSKPGLKREDSFLKRFSTRQIPETQETVDTGDETETANGCQMQQDVNRRRRKRRKEMSRTVVNPDENFYFYWLMTVTVCVLYNLWTLIVRQSFPELQKAASSFWYAGDGFTDVVFVCDIVVQFRTGYLEQGLMVYNSKKLASHYLKSRAFILDILSLLPIDFLQFNLGVNPILRFPRFLKVYRVYNYYYIVESRTVYPNLWRVVNLIHILLILAHWFGCFYYLLSEAEGFQGDWVYPYRPGDYATLTRKYLGSLYWSTLTLTTIGDLPTPETNAESRGRSKAMTSSGHTDGIHRRGHKSRLLQFNSNSGYLFTIISYLIGVFIFATIVGQVGNVITNRNANRLEFERLLDGAKTYMRHHKVPGGMKRRVLRWYDYSWSRGRIQGGGDINTALGLLPDKLKTELALHVNLSVLKKVTIFQECQPEFLHDLVLKMKAYIFTPGDLICRKGEVAREMFIIADGILDVISENGRVLTTMKAGDFFGEIGILNLDGLNKRTADVRSVGYSELFSLSREDVLTAMKDYPEAQEILQSLGRKRLMEAKNASKMHKAQVKQVKDPDSSGDSDTAGKRIVEKLRSDVKGLKNALRRSRRGTRTKDTFDGNGDTPGGKSYSKKQSILRRMSHVQSSDEYEGNNEIVHSPIGAGLPLLQRLKILKEKQEKEREEKEKNKGTHGGIATKDEVQEKEVIGAGLPLTQRLKLLKQKEEKQAAASGPAVVSSTVRTQVTGVRFDKTMMKAKTITSPPKEPEDKSVAGDVEAKRKDSVEVGRVSLKEKLKLVQSQAKGKLNSRTPEPPSITSSNLTSETSNNVPVDEENPVPKLGSKLEVPKSKDGWKLLKKSSITAARSKDVRKVPKKGTYLSKSDTVLEKQKTIEKDEEKRSRSISPSDGSKSQRKSLKQTVEDLMSEKRRARSLSHSPKRNEGKDDVNFWEFPAKEGDSKEEKDAKEVAEKKHNMKKYNSISDLSPEYSGLPFVKKLKILNERQKLEELEKELLVRSASLDVPERPTTKRGNILVRSQSEASTMELKKDCPGVGSFNNEWPNERRQPTELRDVISENDGAMQPDSTIASPESNETLERRHLKSILKKLSGEDSTSDEDAVRNIKSNLMKRSENAELKKLMRAPTVEGYAARHKKLTKSVTFDSDALPSPPEPVPQEQQSDEKSKNFSPMSPTAILTLQLSNLSMIPIVSPKKTEKKEEKEKQETKVVEQLQEETIAKKLEKENPFTPYIVHELVERNFRLLPLIKSQDDELFGQIKGGILEVLHLLLEDVQKKFQSQFDSLQVEVKKRDDIIAQLQSKIHQLEQRHPNKRESKMISEAFHRDSNETDPDLSEEPFLRGDSFETIRGVNSPPSESVNIFMSRRGSPAGAENSNKVGEPTLSTIPFDHLGNVITSEMDDDIFEMKDKISLLPTDSGARRGFRRCLDQQSDEEMEMTERTFWSNEFKRKRHRTDFKLKRNFSVDETRLETGSDKKSEWKFRSRGSLMNRVADLQRSFSCSHEGREFVALDIDDSSSDAETTHNKDWEVQMLAEELAKKDPDWEMEEESDLEELEDVKKLQEEVNSLKQMVCESDLTRLTSSELDILEKIIDAKDKKISQIAKSNSLDDEDKSNKQKRLLMICPSGSDNKLKKSERKKPTLRQKIGQALSFDFHDMESRKQDQRPKAFHLRKQKTISGTPRERQSLYDLWHTSSLLRNRMLEDSDKANQNVAGSSLPILISESLKTDKNSELRTSLPLLSRTDVREKRSSASSSEEQGSDFRQSCDSVFEESETMWNFSYPSTSGQVRQSECQSSSSLNNFIKSMGQKVKQVMAGDSNSARSQLPTISRLCDEQAMLKEPEAEVLERFGGVPSEEDPKPYEGEPSQVLDSFDRDPKTDPPDL